jgi:hypothetical protein
MKGNGPIRFPSLAEFNPCLGPTMTIDSALDLPSIFLTNAGLYESTAEERGFALALGSNTIPASQVPAEFWADIDAFFSHASGGLDAKLSDLVIGGGRVVYAGPGGVWEEVPNASVNGH